MADANRFVPEHRRTTYKGKNLFKGDELRRRREEQQVEIRKQKRDENLAKRRNLNAVVATTDASMESDTDEDSIAGDERVLPLFWVNFLTRSGEKSCQDWCRLSIRIISMTNFPPPCNSESFFQRRKIHLLTK